MIIIVIMDIWKDIIAPLTVALIGGVFLLLLSTLKFTYMGLFLILLLLIFSLVELWCIKVQNTKGIYFVGFMLGLFLVGFFLIVVTDHAMLLPNEPTLTASTALSTEIKSPEIIINYTSDTAQIVENITGTAKNIPERHELWILVYAYPAHKYYPQNGTMDIQNGNWSIPAYIGVKDNVGVKFDIIAVLADENARAEFTSYIINGKINNKWPGIDKIPDGAKVYDKITVIREYEKTIVTRETAEAPTSTKISNLLQRIIDLSIILGLIAVICGTYLTYKNYKYKK